MHLVTHSISRRIAKRTIDDPALDLRRLDLENVADDGVRQVATNVLESQSCQAEQADFALKLGLVEVYMPQPEIITVCEK